jgi:hypothetical protein
MALGSQATQTTTQDGIDNSKERLQVKGEDLVFEFEPKHCHRGHRESRGGSPQSISPGFA